MGIVVMLQPQERILQDGEVIASIYRNLGTAAADQVVSRALGELALTLADGKEIALNRDKISQVRLHFSF